MKLTEYEKEVIYRALDSYIALLGSKGDSKTAYEIKTAKEIRKAIHTPKPTDSMTDAEKVAWVNKNTTYGYKTYGEGTQVEIYYNNETAIWQYSIRPIDDIEYWVDSFPTLEEAERICISNGYVVTKIVGVK